MIIIMLAITVIMMMMVMMMVNGDDDDTVQLETMRRSSVYQDYLRPAKVDSLIQKYAYNLTVGDQVSDGIQL